MTKSRSSRVGDKVIIAICLIIVAICLLPILIVLARSLSSPEALIKNKVGLIPVGWNLDAYKTILTDSKYVWSLLWTGILTVMYVALSMLLTIVCAYPLTFKGFKGKTFFSTLFIMTMYFNAGTIPNYLLMKDLHLLNQPAVLIIPGALSVFNMIIMRSFFDGIPKSLREAAQIDGAGMVKILLKIYLPLSKPVIATLALFYAVGRWNGFSDALMFMNNRVYFPIQLLLYNILNNIMQVEVATQEGFTAPGLSETLKAATVMFATIPILLVYPWLQRHFIAGVTLGAVKE